VLGFKIVFYLGHVLGHEKTKDVGGVFRESGFKEILIADFDIFFTKTSQVGDNPHNGREFKADGLGLALGGSQQDFSVTRAEINNFVALPYSYLIKSFGNGAASGGRVGGANLGGVGGWDEEYES